MLPNINLPEDNRSQLAKLVAANPASPDSLATIAHAAGHATVAAALGFKVRNISLTKLDCDLEIDTYKVYENSNIPDQEERVKIAATALFFIAGYVGEILQGTTRAESSVSDRYHAEFCCSLLDALYEVPKTSYFYRVANSASLILTENLGIFAGLIDALDAKGALSESDISASLAMVEKVSLTELLGGLQ